MLSHSELKRGIYFLLQGEPFEVLDSTPMFKGRGSSVMQTKAKSLKTGTILQRSFHAGETFEEASIKKVQIEFLYGHRGKYVFAFEEDPSRRFELSAEQLGDKMKFLVPNTPMEGLSFEGEILNVSLPIKMQFQVDQAPPGVKGDRAQGGTKTVTLENGMEVQAPLFVETGDIIELNTETGEYARRVQE